MAKVLDKKYTICPFCEATAIGHTIDNLCSHVIFANARDEFKIFDNTLKDKLQKNGLPLKLMEDFLNSMLIKKPDMVKKDSILLELPFIFGVYFYTDDKNKLIHEFNKIVESRLRKTTRIEFKTLYNLIYIVEELKHKTKEWEDFNDICDGYNFFDIPEIIWNELKEIGKIKSIDEDEKGNYSDKCYKDYEEREELIALLKSYDIDVNQYYYSNPFFDWIDDAVIDRLPSIEYEDYSQYRDIFEEDIFYDVRKLLINPEKTLGTSKEGAFITMRIAIESLVEKSLQVCPEKINEDAKFREKLELLMKHKILDTTSYSICFSIRNWSSNPSHYRTRKTKFGKLELLRNLCNLLKDILPVFRDVLKKSKKHRILN